MKAKRINLSFFARRIAVGMVCCLTAVMGAYAVPAYPGWQTKQQPDGQDIEVRQVGDEFYHFWETREGTVAYEQADGLFVTSTEAVPSADEFRARRAAKQSRQVPKTSIRRAPKGVGGDPNLAPRGVVILVNFSDSLMQGAHTREVFDDMCNAEHCTTNANDGKNYGSAAQYFADQSKGSYRPVFDVFGPVTLKHPLAYYGEQGEMNGSVENDMYMADFVIDAIEAADEAGCDFSQYDSDNDGWVDFVYFIYAGRGQAYGGGTETIWPHNWHLNSALYLGFTHGESGYFINDEEWIIPCLDGKYVDNYACSAELDGYDNLGGIGTLCHEFGHVMGLPDLYDIHNGEIGANGLTPGEWNIMAGGSYNGNMHCPPNYDPWQKYYFGWVIPENLGEEASNKVLHANGTTEQNTYQINYYGTQQGPTAESLNYYLEYRQQSGWDEYLPAHGLAVWKVHFDATAWRNNAPNGSNTDKAPRHMIETVGEVTWDGVIGKPISDAIESDGVLYFKYKGGDDSAYPALPEPRWSDWAYYDNGTYKSSLGYGDGHSFYWGIMFPAWSLGNDLLTKIAVYEIAEYNTQPITIAVYSGGGKPVDANRIYTETVDPSGQTGYHEITLSQPVAFNPKKNLWVILNAGTDNYPATYSENAGEPNGRWESYDGADWVDIKEYNMEHAFMIRAYVESNPNSASTVVRKAIKLVPNMWAIDEARFAAWTWGEGIESEWATFSGSSDTLVAQVNERASQLLFFRYNPALGLSWEAEWNRTADQTINWESGMFAITGWGNDGVSEGAWLEVQETTEIEEIMEEKQPKTVRKFLHEGQLYIQRDGKVYSVIGERRF